MKKSILPFIFFLLVFLAYDCNAQRKKSRKVESEKILLKMKNGDEFNGVIVREDDKNLVLKTENGELNLIKANIVSKESNKYEGEFRFQNPHDTRYFYGPTAIPIKKGRGYYQNIMLSSNTINYGLTDNLSVGGGFEFLSLIYGNPIWTFNPKIGFKVSENFYAGGGLLVAGVAAEGAGILPYGVATFGNSDSNFSLGAGYGFATNNEFDENENLPVLTISGTHRLSNSIALLSENYVLPSIEDFGYFGVHGIRILSPKNAFDIGIIFVPGIYEDTGIPVIPYVGYARAF
jgi:hypothetical protein